MRYVWEYTVLSLRNHKASVLQETRDSFQNIHVYLIRKINRKMLTTKQTNKNHQQQTNQKQQQHYNNQKQQQQQKNINFTLGHIHQASQKQRSDCPA